MNHRRVFAAAIWATVLAGCGANPERLVPDLSDRHYTPAMATLRVMPVPETPFALRTPGTPTGAHFREAVVRALRNSNLFRAVVTDGAADFLLKTNVSAKFLPPTRAPQWEARYECIADYELVDAATGKTLWTNAIRSVAGSTALGGAKRIAESSENSVRENVKTLVTQAAENWPRGK
jgi:hypothetical protein